MLQIIQLDDIPSQPWRNGGGATHQLLAWPAPHDWTIRISVARIDHNGPFSVFPGIDRWFAVVLGAGVALQLADARMALTHDSEPLHFDGAVAPDCELLDGATSDLNLMVRRDRGAGLMVRALSNADWHAPAGFRAVFTAEPAALVIDDTPPVLLRAGDLAWTGDASSRPWRVTSRDAPVRAWFLAVQLAPG
jgi:uncharacterized protein